ncbi:MAG: beta-galactosidase trimerization domain-containing protein, partial [Terriglobales bacterium]
MPVFLAFLLLINMLWLAPAAQAAAPVAVLHSAHNAQAYQDEHLGTFDDDWVSFRQALEAANVRFDELSDADVAAGPSKLSGYKLIVVPLLVDETPEVVAGLSEFTRGGGKLLITDAGGAPQQNAQAIEQLAGAVVTKQSTAADIRKLQWPKQPLPLTEEFAVGSVTAIVNPVEGAQPLATWTDSNGAVVGPAVVKKGNAIFLAWAPGLQGDITSNANLITNALEELSPGITQQSAVQISFADFQSIQQELEYLTKRTEETIKTAKQADLAVPFKIIQQHYDSALANVKKFEEAYHARRYYEADELLNMARQDFSLAFAQAMPVRPVEARNVWLDRGT